MSNGLPVESGHRERGTEAPGPGDIAVARSALGYEVPGEPPEAGVWFLGADGEWIRAERLDTES